MRRREGFVQGVMKQASKLSILFTFSIKYLVTVGRLGRKVLIQLMSGTNGTRPVDGSILKHLLVSFPTHSSLTHPLTAHQLPEKKAADFPPSLFSPIFNRPR